MINKTVGRLFVMLAMTPLLLGTGCNTLYPPVVVKDPAKWNENCAVEMINKAKRVKPHLDGYYGSKAFNEGRAHNVDKSGLTCVSEVGPDSAKVYLRHIPFNEISAIRVMSEDVYGAAIILLGNPLCMRLYRVEVDAGGREFCFWESTHDDYLFPMCMFYPFHFLSADRRKYAEELAEAFEYLRLSHTIDRLLKKESK